MRHLTVVLLAGAVLTLGACQSGWTWRVGICPWWTRARPTRPSTTPTSRSVARSRLPSTTSTRGGRRARYSPGPWRALFTGAVAGQAHMRANAHFVGKIVLTV